MKLKIELDNNAVKELIFIAIANKLGLEANIDRKAVNIEVMTKNNYRVHEWEKGEFRVSYEGEI